MSTATTPAPTSARDVGGTARADATPAVRSGARRPRLRLMVPPIRTSWRPSFVLVCVSLMVSCLVALLGINIALTRGAYTEQQLTVKQTALMERQQSLAEKVDRASAPEVLAQRARDLGMIPNSTPSFIRLSDGRILGVPTPATVSDSPKFSDLAASELTPEQYAVAAAAANGGVAGVGPDGLPTGQSVLPGDREQLNPADLARQVADTAPAAEPSNPAETSRQATTNDGATSSGSAQAQPSEPAPDRGVDLTATPVAGGTPQTRPDTTLNATPVAAGQSAQDGVSLDGAVPAGSGQ